MKQFVFQFRSLGPLSTDAVTAAFAGVVQAWGNLLLYSISDPAFSKLAFYMCRCICLEYRL